MLPEFDDGVLEERGAPEAELDPEGVLMLPAGRFEELGVQAGDLVGLRVTGEEFEVARVWTRRRWSSRRLP